MKHPQNTDIKGKKQILKMLMSAKQSCVSFKLILMYFPKYEMENKLHHLQLPVSIGCIKLTLSDEIQPM